MAVKKITGRVLSVLYCDSKCSLILDSGAVVAGAAYEIGLGWQRRVVIDEPFFHIFHRSEPTLSKPFFLPTFFLLAGRKARWGKGKGTQYSTVQYRYYVWTCNTLENYLH